MVKAIILAAGQSSRLHPLTITIPKCLLKIGNTTILDYNLSILERAGIEDIVLLVGHQGHILEEKYGNRLECIFYEDYKKTNNLYTLNSAIRHLDQETLVMFSDVLIDFKTLKNIINSKSDYNLLVHQKDILEGTMKVKVRDDSIHEIGSHIPQTEADGNFVGIAKFSSNGTKVLRSKIKSICETKKMTQEYYTVVLNEIAFEGGQINFVNVETPWIEIDTIEDYEKARTVVFPTIINS